MSAAVGVEAIAEIVGEFSQQCRHAIENIAAATSDDRAVRDLLHLIKGCASNVGADRLVVLADEARGNISQGMAINSSDMALFTDALGAASAKLQQALATAA